MNLPSAPELTAWLRAHIPLAAAMGAEVTVAEPELVELRAPLAPNLNHRGTVFGGSAVSLALLAGWALLHARLAAAGFEARLVIQEQSMHYRRPLDGDFTARCALPPAPAWDRFADALRRKGAGRITLRATLAAGGADAAYFEGEYVALAQPAAG